MGFPCYYRPLPLLSRIFRIVKFLKIIAPKTGQIPQQQYHSMSNFRKASG